jgi:hypothetical protein
VGEADFEVRKNRRMRKNSGGMSQQDQRCVHLKLPHEVRLLNPRISSISQVWPCPERDST